MLNVEWAPLQLPVEVTSVRVAREALRAWAADVGMDLVGLEALLWITSELVTNAVMVAVDPVEIRFGMDGGSARVEVDDDGPGWPTVRAGSEDGGFGLRLVDELAERWGCIDRSGHKTVWAEVPLSR